MTEQRIAGLMVGPARRTEVDRWLRRRDLAPRLRERLEMVKAVGLGQDLPTIARGSGRTERTLRRWLRPHAGGGGGPPAGAPPGGGACPAGSPPRPAAPSGPGRGP